MVLLHRDRGLAVLLSEDQIHVGARDEVVLGDSQLFHQLVGDLHALLLALPFGQRDLQLEEVAESRDLVAVHPCLADHEQATGLHHLRVNANATYLNVELFYHL